MNKRTKGFGLIMALTVINAIAINFLPVMAASDNNTYDYVETYEYVDVIAYDLEPIQVQTLSSNEVEEKVEVVKVPVEVKTSGNNTTLEVEELEEVIEEDPYLYDISDEDRLLFEHIISAEAYSFWSEEDCLALASVIVNRVNCDWYFDDTFREVLVEPTQFETYSNGRYLEVEVFDAARNAVDRALRGETNVNSDVLFFCTEEYYETLDNPEEDFFLTLGDADYQVRNVLFFESFPK